MSETLKPGALEGELLSADHTIEEGPKPVEPAAESPSAANLGAMGGAALGALFAASKGEAGESSAATLGRGAAGALFGAFAGAALGALVDALAGGGKKPAGPARLAAPANPEATASVVSGAEVGAEAQAEPATEAQAEPVTKNQAEPIDPSTAPQPAAAGEGGGHA